MRSAIGSYQSEIGKINESKYACQPSWDLIQKYLDSFNMRLAHFERFFGVPYNTLTQVKAGTRIFPTYCWHFVYEKIKPRYGVGFVIHDKKLKEQKLRIKNAKKTKIKPVAVVSVDSHSRLLDIK